MTLSLPTSPQRPLELATERGLSDIALIGTFVSPDALVSAIAVGHQEVWTVECGGWVRVRSAVSGEVLRQRSLSGREPTSMAANDRSVWVGTSDGVIIVLDVATARPVAECVLHEASITALLCHGAHLWSASSDGQLAVWDAGVATNGESGAVCVFSFEGVSKGSREPAARLIAAHQSTVLSLMQEDPLRLWSGAEDGTIVVSTYDARARALVPQHTLRGHQGAVHCIQREPNGARVWSASLDGALLTWDRERLQPLARMPISFPPRARHFVFTVAPVAAATAQRLWCCGTDGTVRCFLSLTPSDDVDAVAARRADAARRYTELTAAEAAARAALTEAAQQVLLTHYIDEARAVAETAWAHAQRADAVARRAEAAAAAAARQLEEESVASAAATQRSITLQQQLEALGETSMALRLALDGGAADARAAQAQLRFDIAQLEGRVADLTAEAASARAALGHRAAELQAVAAARDTLQRALMHRDEERQNLEQHLAEARAREAQLRLTVSSLEEQLAVAREREAGSAHSAALRDDHARGVELQLQALRAELETARADARRVTEMKSLAVRERDECRAHVQRLQQLHEGEVTENAAELERLQLRIAQLDVNAVRSEDARVALSAALAASRDEGALLARECDVLKAEIAQLTRELLAARQGAEAHAGETAAVRQQMEVLRMSLVTPAAVATAPLKVLPNPRRPTSPPRPVVPSAALEIPPRVNFSTAARIALYPAVDRGLNSPPPRPFSPVDAPRAASTTASPRRTPARITGPLPLWSPSHE